MKNKEKKERTAQIPAIGVTGEQPSCNTYNTIISEFHPISMTELYENIYPLKLPIVEGFLNSGTYLFVGAPKIGKSFFMAQLAYHISMGIPLWNYKVRKGSVLYLALEDDYARLQQRLSRMFDVESSDEFFMVTKSKTLNDGLDLQLEEFIKEHEDARLIIIDTLQKVREAGGEHYSYSNDYEIVTRLKEFSDAHNICLLVVHHTRKMEAQDSFEMISGTNGLLGASDGAFIMQKKKRTDKQAIMSIVGRDQQDQELTLEFDREKCLWNKVKSETECVLIPVEPILEMIATFMEGRSESWRGSASELLEAIPKLDVKSNVLVRKLNVKAGILYKDYGILYEQLPRTQDKKEFSLTKVEKLIN
ncbi:hypothetical protein P261_01559 [Lachnospiraceae bacterium TWA4]|nr:hypothetical protein P261_01559 [Lachnospiraceae bacterium TWA4]